MRYAVGRQAASRAEKLLRPWHDVARRHPHPLCQRARVALAQEAPGRVERLVAAPGRGGDDGVDQHRRAVVESPARICAEHHRQLRLAQPDTLERPDVVMVERRRLDRHRDPARFGLGKIEIDDGGACPRVLRPERAGDDGSPRRGCAHRSTLAGCWVRWAAPRPHLARPTSYVRPTDRPTSDPRPADFGRPTGRPRPADFGPPTHRLRTSSDHAQGRRRVSRTNSARPVYELGTARVRSRHRPGTKSAETTNGRPRCGGGRSAHAAASQALGRLPWLAALPLRDLRLRPRLLMAVLLEIDGITPIVPHLGHQTHPSGFTAPAR